MKRRAASLAASSSARLTDRIEIGVLTRLVPRGLIDERRPETGRRGQRPRVRLLMSWYVVIASAVFRNGYEELTRRLTAGLPFMRAWHKVGGSHP